MFIRSDEIRQIEEVLKNGLESGHTSLVYDSGFVRSTSFLFFNSIDDAKQFCIDNYSDFDRYNYKEIQPVLLVFEEMKLKYSARTDIDYYFINSAYEVSPSLKVNPDGNALHDPDGNDFTDALIDEMEGKVKVRLEKTLDLYPSTIFSSTDSADDAYLALKAKLTLERYNNYSQLNNTTMNEQNLEYLKNTLKYFGFEDRVNAELERKVRAGEPYFTLNDSKEFNNGNLKTDSVLYFSRGKENEMYFFNKYDIAVTKADGRSENQTMYINRATMYNEEKQMDQTKLIGFTLKEAANLLDRDENGMGRAVYKQFVKKDNEQYTAWKQIDFSKQDDNGNYKFKTYHENYGFDMKQAVYSLQFIEDEEKVMQSLQKGNKQAVTIEENGQQVRRFLAADPENRRLMIFDEKGMEIKQDVKAVNLNYDKKPEQEKAAKEGVKKDGVNVSTAESYGTAPDGPSKKNSNNEGVKKGKGAKVKDEESLLRKNRESKGKGMKM